MISPIKRQTKRKQVTMSIDTHVALERIANKLGINISQVIRNAITEYIHKFPNTVLGIEESNPYEGEEVRLVMTRKAEGKRYLYGYLNPDTLDPKLLNKDH